MTGRGNGAVALLRHRLRVGHGVPAIVRGPLQALERWTGAGFQAAERERLRQEARAAERRFAGQTVEIMASRLPPGLAERVPVGAAEIEGIAGPVAVRAHAMTPAVLDEIAVHLREHGRRALAGVSIREVLGILAAAARRWLDPAYGPRQFAIEAIHRVSGYAREMVAWSIDLEMRSSLAFDLWRALVSELGNPFVLDRRAWAPTGEAPAEAYGPKLLAAVFSSNIPALPHLTYMRGLAVKAPVLGKVATQEPVFTGLYLDTLGELRPDLREALAAVWFPGGSEACEAALFARAGYAIAYGTDAALAALGRQVPPQVRRTFHGHRMSVGLLGREALGGPGRSRLVEDVAYDLAVFDGQACLAPLVYFAEARDLQAGLALARDIGAALEALAAWLPRRTLGPEDRAARRNVIDRWEVAATFGGQAAFAVRRASKAQEWAGFVTQGEYVPQPVGDRLFHLHCVADLDEAVRAMAPYERYLQNVAIAAPSVTRARLAHAFAALGATRITVPGLMPTPSMMWHHDGHLCLAELVRWSDIG